MGYAAHILDLYDFTDNNECSDGTHLCSANATCVNTDGGYNCSCDPGYEGNGFNCTSKCCVYVQVWYGILCILHMYVHMHVFFEFVSYHP